MGALHIGWRLTPIPYFFSYKHKMFLDAKIMLKFSIKSRIYFTLNHNFAMKQVFKSFNLL